MKQSIEEIYSIFPHKIRLIIDDLTGMILEEFPNIKERARNNKIFYSNSSFGKFIVIKPNYDFVEIIFLKKKKIFIFKDSNEINFDILRKVLI